MAFAIILTGGKQYKVAQGDKVRVEKLAGKEGDSVEIPHVILRSEDDTTAELGKPFLSSPVQAKIVKQGVGDKVGVYKMKAKKNYARNKSHRQTFTELEIIKI